MPPKLLAGTYVEKTSSACTITEYDRNYISGYYIDGKEWNKSRCEKECDKYPWCRGIGVKNEGGHCKLLGDLEQNPWQHPGWNQSNYGNWAEPDQWSKSPDKVDEDYKCYAKYLTGLLDLMR